jgi:hypothetical protein
MMAAALICGLIVVGLLLSMSAAGAFAAGDTGTPTPQNNSTTSPTPTAVPTAVPSPAPRQVFSTVSWDVDHAAVLVTNNGEAIDVEAYIGSLSNKTTTHVGAGITTRVPTMTISAASGQIIRCWFKAYENGTLIDSMEVPVTVAAGTPTPPPAKASLNGIITDTSNNPVTGAEVTFESATWGNKYTVVTDTSGQYSVSAMIPDTYKITITAGGYQIYRAMTDGVISDIQQMSPIILQKLPSGTTPTPTPAPSATSSPTPGSPIDAWVNLLYNPTICISTLALGLGAIVSATAIYEWTIRQRERRRKEAEDKKGTKSTDDTKDAK